MGILPLVFLTPPFQVPDEQQHFYKSYQISELRFVGFVKDGDAGDNLPSSLLDLVLHFSGTNDTLSGRELPSIPLSDTLRELDRPLSVQQRTFIPFSGAAHYSPLPYVPQAFAMAMGRAFGVGPLALFYIARLSNALTGILMLTLAVRRMPAGREAFLVLALLPMALFEYASVSPDCMVIASTLLFTAIALRCRANGRWGVTDISLATLCGAVFCTIKAPYAPLLLLALPSALPRNPARNGLLAQTIVLVVAIGATGGWLRSAASLVVSTRNSTDIRAQASYIIEGPLRYAAAILRGFWYNDFYYEQFIGRLGWLEISLPTAGYWLPVVALTLAVLFRPAGEVRTPLRRAVWDGLLVGFSTALVMTALYLYFTPVGNYVVEGVQGRYFLPLTGLAVMTLCSIVPVWAPVSVTVPALRISALLVLVEIGLMQWTIARTYGVLP